MHEDNSVACFATALIIRYKITIAWLVSTRLLRSDCHSINTRCAHLQRLQEAPTQEDPPDRGAVGVTGACHSSAVWTISLTVSSLTLNLQSFYSNVCLYWRDLRGIYIATPQRLQDSVVLLPSRSVAPAGGHRATLIARAFQPEIESKDSKHSARKCEQATVKQIMSIRFIFFTINKYQNIDMESFVSSVQRIHDDTNCFIIQISK